MRTSFPDWQNNREIPKIESTAAAANAVVNLQHNIVTINQNESISDNLPSGTILNQVLLGLEFFIDFAWDVDVIQQRNQVPAIQEPESDDTETDEGDAVVLFE